jgi:hypothetical protein
LPYAYCTAAYLGPRAVYLAVTCLTAIIPVPLGRSIWLRASIAVRKLIANNCKDKILPEAICDALLQPDDPLAAREVKWIFPDWPPNTRVEEKVVSRRQKGRRRMKVCPE